MGESPHSSPRFRIRLEDGDEMPVNSVEALARRVARGDLNPETQLFDASTGAWQRAADASVVQFILDEMARDGVERPLGWEVESRAEPPPTESGEAPAVVGRESSTLEPEESDPLALELTLALPEEPSDHPPEPLARREAEQESDDPRAVVSAHAPARAKDELITPRSAGGLFAPAASEAESNAAGPAVPGNRDPSPHISRRWGGSLSMKWKWVAGLSLLGVVLAVAGLGFGNGGPGEPEVETLAAPEGLEELAERIVDVTEERYQVAIDSVRLVHALSDAPPEDWLTGDYLANAGEFPEVPDFWNSYAGMLEDLRESDESIFLAAVAGSPEASGASTQDIPILETYLSDLHAAGLPVQLDLHAQLGLVASAALELHGFLTEQTDAIGFTPALGTGALARDPILEVRTADPAVREELDRHLDELFQALDRSRGGGTPSPTGLRDELFESFSPF